MHSTTRSDQLRELGMQSIPGALMTNFRKPQGYRPPSQEGFLLEWNNLPALERLFARFGDDIAAVIMEPVMVNNSGCVPEPGYLQGVRELYDRYGTLLIFDEVLTGFRIDLQGAGLSSLLSARVYTQIEGDQPSRQLRL